MDSSIQSVEVRLYHVPLDEELGDASHDKHTHFELIMCLVTTQDGLVGTGYTYTGGVGGSAIYELLRRDVAPALVGRDADCVEGIWADLRRKLHYVGRGGIESFAISAVDVALWDLRGRRAGMPLWKLAGGAAGYARAYAGGIDLAFPHEKLLANVRRYLSEGHDAVKIKLGRENPAEDVRRVAAVRELLGPERTFMADANYKWTAEQAVRMCRKLAPYDLLWLEEPVDPDDLAGMQRVAEQGGLAIAAGENFHSVYEFENMFEGGWCDFPQPDASNVGGITGWLKVAAMAYARHKTVSSHGMQELHVSLLSAVPNAGWMEVHSFPIDRYTEQPCRVQKGRVYPPDAPGTGVRFRCDVLAPYRIL